MSISFVAAARSTSAVSNELLKTCPKPTGTVQNDFMLAHVWAYRETVTSAPTGWALLEQNETSEAAETEHDFNSYLYYKIAGASEPADYTWETTTVTSPTPTRRVVIATYRGVLTSGPTSEDRSTHTEDAAGPTLTFPSMNTGAAGRRQVAMASGAITLPTATMPSPWVERYDEVGQFVFDRAIVVAGATSTGVLTLSHTMTSWGFTVMLVAEPDDPGDRNYCGSVDTQIN